MLAEKKVGGGVDGGNPPHVQASEKCGNCSREFTIKHDTGSCLKRKSGVRGVQPLHLQSVEQL